MASIRKILFSIFLCSLMGCAGVTDYYVSRPDTDESDVVITKNGFIKKEDLTLLVRSTNGVVIGEGIILTLPLPPIPFVDEMDKDQYRYASPYYQYNNTTKDGSEYFFIEVLLKAETNEYSINPKQIFLETEGAVRIAPVSFIHPKSPSYSKYAKSHYQYPLCCPESKPPSPFAVTSYQEEQADKWLNLPVGEEWCFAIKFNIVPPPPNSVFYLKLNGLRKNEKEVAIPRIKYITTKYRNIHN